MSLLTLQSQYSRSGLDNKRLSVYDKMKSIYEGICLKKQKLWSIRLSIGRHEHLQKVFDMSVEEGFIGNGYGLFSRAELD